MNYKYGDRVVHDAHGVGTIQEAGINGLCRVAFDSGTIAIIETSELANYFAFQRIKLFGVETVFRYHLDTDG